MSATKEELERLKEEQRKVDEEVARYEGMMNEASLRRPFVHALCQPRRAEYYVGHKCQGGSYCSVYSFPKV